jgi:hypothetical protein
VPATPRPTSARLIRRIRRGPQLCLNILRDTPVPLRYGKTVSLRARRLIASMDKRYLLSLFGAFAKTAKRTHETAEKNKKSPVKHKRSTI